MPSAYVDATQVEFPPSCPHCGQPAEAGRRIAAHGLIDVLVGEYGQSLNIWIPVCRAAARKRKWFGVAVVAGEVMLILLGGLLAVAVSMAGHNTASAIVVLAAVSIALPIRGDLDAMFSDWYVVGVCAWRDFGRGKRIRLSFRRDQYYSQWASMNPSASTSGADNFRPPPPPPPDDPNTPLDPIIYSRRIPAIALVVSAVAVALHHWYAVNGGHVFLVALCLLTAVGVLAIGGIVYPPVFWSISAYGTRLPLPLKVVGAVLGLAGLAGGFVLGISYGR